MSSSKLAYLAERYMAGPKADAILARHGDGTQKKKRKKLRNEDYIGGAPSKEETSSGLVMRDEDEWRVRGGDDDDIEGEDAPVLAKGVTTFKKSKSGWSTVGSSAIPVASTSASAEAGPSSPTPEIKPDPDAPAAPPPKKKKIGGLRTAAQLRADAEAERAQRSLSPEDPEMAAHRMKTVHRDASGRVIDVEKIKEEERRKEEEEKRKAAEREEWTKGLTQRQERERRAEEERRMAQSDVARLWNRHANDASMNRDLKDQERWNDPAAAFLSKKSKKKGPRRPKYQGAHPLNRFGIPPGYRWDGVDRSNGFEKKYFQYRNAAARREIEQQAWSMEDM